jgi:sRNA-binding protein
MRRVLALALLSITAACGSITYIRQVPFNAADKVENARSLNAAKFSPYWWTRATEYLRMAREVAAHADFQGANHFGQLSAEAADKASAEAEERGRDPSKMPKNPMEQGNAPAKDDAAPAKDGVAPAKDGVAPAKDE